jgi:hypothetical protein
MQLFAKQIAQKASPAPVYTSFKFMSSSNDAVLGIDQFNATQMIKHLATNFLLVAPVEYMNEFLVLIALHMGWELTDLYSPACKGPVENNARLSQFKECYPVQYV